MQVGTYIGDKCSPKTKEMDVNGWLVVSLVVHSSIGMHASYHAFRNKVSFDRLKHQPAKYQRGVG